MLLGAIGLAEKEILRFKFFMRSQRVMWHHGRLSVPICHHPDNSGGIGLAEEQGRRKLFSVGGLKSNSKSLTKKD